jgi:hypothetical protein
MHPNTPTARLQSINKHYFPDKPLPVVPKRELDPQILGDIEALFTLCVRCFMLCQSFRLHRVFSFCWHTSLLAVNPKPCKLTPAAFAGTTLTVVAAWGDPPHLPLAASFLANTLKYHDFSKDELRDAMGSCGLDIEELEDFFARLVPTTWISVIRPCLDRLYIYNLYRRRCVARNCFVWRFADVAALTSTATDWYRSKVRCLPYQNHAPHTVTQSCFQSLLPVWGKFSNDAQCQRASGWPTSPWPFETEGGMQAIYQSWRWKRETKKRSSRNFERKGEWSNMRPRLLMKRRSCLLL